MPWFNQKITNNQIIVDIVIKQTDKDEGISINDHVFKALVDTGAQSSCINNSVVDKLQLTPKGLTETVGIHGENKSEYYIVDIILPVPEGNSLQGKGKEKCIVSKMNMKASNFDVLLGMDIIKTLNLHMHDGFCNICI